MEKKHGSTTDSTNSFVIISFFMQQKMRIHRVTTLLHSVAEVRNWIVQNIQGTTSLIGYDLFLKIGNDFQSGQPLLLSSICQALPYYSQETIQLEIQRMERIGLLEQRIAEGGTQYAVIPTQRFIALLSNYQRKFESVFILREELRQQQLRVSSVNSELTHFAESLYDHFYDLGWLYLHNFGAVCFLMASLVKEVASLYGYTAQIQSGYVEIASQSHLYLLGAKGYATAGQIEGHAVCVINDALLIDFGLGNVRKGYRRDFYWALACDYQPNENVIGKMALPSGQTVTWKNDWQSPDSDEELRKYEPGVKQLSQHYLNYFG